MANYIKTMQRDVAMAEAAVEEYENGISEIVGYLTSRKFDAEPTVQVRDVIARLQEVRSRAGEFSG